MSNFSAHEEDYNLAVQRLKGKVDDYETQNQKIQEESISMLTSIIQSVKDFNEKQVVTTAKIFIDYAMNCIYIPCKIKAIQGLHELISHGFLYTVSDSRINDIIELLIIKSDEDIYVYDKCYAYQALIKLTELYDLSDVQIGRVIDHCISINSMNAKPVVTDHFFDIVLIIAKSKLINGSSVDKLIDYLMKYVNANHEGSKLKAMEVIGLLAARGLITSHVKVNEIIVAMMNKMHVTSDACRRRALYVIFKIVEQKAVPITKFNTIFDALIIKATDKDSETRKIALESLTLLIQSTAVKSIDRNKMYKLYEVIVTGCSDRSDPSRAAAITAISWLAYAKLIPDDRIVNVVELVLEKIRNDRNSEHRLKAVSAMSMLAQHNIVPIIKVNDVLDTMAGKIDDSDDTIRFMCVFVLTQLLKYRMVPNDRTSEVKLMIRNRSSSPKHMQDDVSYHTTTTNEDNQGTLITSGHDQVQSVDGETNNDIIEANASINDSGNNTQSNGTLRLSQENVRKQSLNKANLINKSNVRQGALDCWSIFPKDGKSNKGGNSSSKEASKSSKGSPSQTPRSVSTKPSLRFPLRNSTGNGLPTNTNTPSAVPVGTPKSSKRATSVSPRLSASSMNDITSKPSSNGKPIPTKSRSDSTSSWKPDIAIAIPIDDKEKLGLDRKDSSSSKGSKESKMSLSECHQSTVITSPTQIFDSVRPKSKPLLQVKTR